MDYPSLCANGCGFFGSPENQNMCSKCYKDCILKKMICESKRNISVLSSSTNEHKNDHESSISMAKNFGASASKYEEFQQKKRCKSCNKKVGVTGFTCRCGDMFCGKQRYPEEHSCTVDYKKIGRELLKKQNPLCKADKVSKV